MQWSQAGGAALSSSVGPNPTFVVRLASDAQPSPNIGSLLPPRTSSSCVWVAVLAMLATAVACSEPIVQMNHGPPNEAAGQMCVVCHTCGHDGTIAVLAPTIDQNHDVCNHCHLPDGSVVHPSGEGCLWEMDCDANPPSVNCNECHTTEHVNNLCETCH